jgi:NADH:ubiquinone oxidoreductase subunit K
LCSIKTNHLLQKTLRILPIKRQIDREPSEIKMQNLSILGIRLFAFYILVQAFTSLQKISPQYYFEASNNSAVILNLVAFLGLIIMFFALFKGAKKISRFIIPESDELKIAIDDYKKLSAILFSTLGLYIIYSSYNMILSTISITMNLTTARPELVSSSNYLLVYLFGGVFQFIAGLLLFIFGKKIAQWWNG